MPLSIGKTLQLKIKISTSEIRVLKAKNKLIPALIFIPALVACGGGDGNTPASISPAQCRAEDCGPHGAPEPLPTAKQEPLCPTDQDIGRATYTGGAGSGEILTLKIDAIAMRYTLTWFESPIPVSAKATSPTRAGITLTGAVKHPAYGSFATGEQRRCAFVLQPGEGTSTSTNIRYSTKETFNPAKPPTIFVGFGVAGGGIPGAILDFEGQPTTALLANQPAIKNTVEVLRNKELIDKGISVVSDLEKLNKHNFLFNYFSIEDVKSLGGVLNILKKQESQKILDVLLDPRFAKQIPLSVGTVKSRRFDFYPFIGFSSTSKDKNLMRGKYNGLIYHSTPSSNHSVAAAIFSETLADNGVCKSASQDRLATDPDKTGCLSTGKTWEVNKFGYFDSANSPQIGDHFIFPISRKSLKDAASVLNKIVHLTKQIDSHASLINFIADRDLGDRMNEIASPVGLALGDLEVYLESASEKWTPTIFASSHMVLGQLNGSTIPIIVRTGAVKLDLASNGYLDTQVDDESGIAILVPHSTAIPQNLDGTYIGADSNFDYTAAYFKGTAAAFSDPMTLKPRDQITLDYKSSESGIVDIGLPNNPKVSGHLVSIGGIYATLIDGTVNGGVSGDAATFGTYPYILPAQSAPYFGIGAKVGK
ncbi:hypothetical protein BWP39_09835 [Paraburkholderia acidicola]|uniref:Uncharacterized protein n=1 Tax=Paraburkholderia acidicola TaxID=1912599 RepID=A0A2A4F280_9BURK|nr:DUF2957 domain-containing protein [Paraburkholderia acidicola]PCE27077.1 hypothetical protein BWP39_09835 [Paraburkholderia acidicola]